MLHDEIFWFSNLLSHLFEHLINDIVDNFLLPPQLFHDRFLKIFKLLSYFFNLLLSQQSFPILYIFLQTVLYFLTNNPTTSNLVWVHFLLMTVIGIFFHQRIVAWVVLQRFGSGKYFLELALAERSIPEAIVQHWIMEFGESLIFEHKILWIVTMESSGGEFGFADWFIGFVLSFAWGTAE